MSKLDDISKGAAEKFPGLDRNKDQKVDVGDFGHGIGEVVEELESHATNWWRATVVAVCAFVAGCIATYYVLGSNLMKATCGG